MNKEETIEALENAKKLHIQQMDKIKALIQGEEIENPTPVGKMECDFGKIFYGKKDDFFHILGAQFYEKLDLLHEKWHIDYVKINTLFFQEKKGGFFSKLIGSNKINPLDYDKAKLYFVELSSITEELLRLLDASLRRVGALSDSKFKS
jgi:hypothetical protein